jgi:hypothetical protein
MVVKGEEWCTLETYNKKRKQPKEFSDFDEFDKVTKGQLHLATDKGERKSTGSYYTPDYIVNYIVDNTIGPVVEEKWNEAKAKEQSHVDATLSVKVLDPAMGSGHFLVGSIEFLAGKLLLAAQIDIENGMISEDSHFTDDWARREVVSHCIYGVDLNYMAVELAKVSLWLTTISKDKPLSFLDHRLKQGNSLIGAQLIDLPWYPDLKDKTKKRENTTLQKFEDEVHRPFVDKIVQQLTVLSEIDDDTIEHINQKKALFEKLKENKQYLQIKSIADVYTAVYFGNETTEVNKKPKFAYNDLFWALKGDDREWARKTYKPWFKNAMRIASDKSFFHWELEFPEVFFEGGAPKENPGWDAVVGNPPYVRQELITDNKKYFEQNYFIYSGRTDIYAYFIERALNILKSDSLLSFINSRKFMNVSYGHKLRGLILNKTKIISIVDFGDLPVFPDVSAYPCIILLKNNSQHDGNVLQYCKVSNLNFKSLNEYTKKYIHVEQKALTTNEWIFGEQNTSELVIKIENQSAPLQEIYGVPLVGIKTGLNRMFVLTEQQIDEIVKDSKKERQIFKPFISGKSIKRFEELSSNLFLLFPYEKVGDTLRPIKIEDYPNIRYYLESNKQDILARAIIKDKAPKGEIEWFELQQINKNIDFNKPQIIYPDISDYSNFSLNTDGSLIDMTAFIIQTNDMYLISLLNSKLITWSMGLFCARARGDYYRYKTQYVSRLPIRRISFKTPLDRRSTFVEEAKTLHSELFSGGNDKRILDFVDLRLKANPEESDVVHDLLAYLAERMMDMNKEKNIEINGFLNWLEGEIGESVDGLTNKTAIKNYYIHDFETLAKILAKNKKKLKEGYDPTRRGPKEKIQAEYDTSISKLAPLLENIKATDGLIDAIVYKLYGLTEDEIKIVEGAI